ncbi:hypothetical protein EDD22DRAFT_900471 [Suillus occidentalis]|nr:hypothetical protein EDD22DRAFT_900471 [Suillus occidentalis]
MVRRSSIIIVLALGHAWVTAESTLGSTHMFDITVTEQCSSNFWQRSALKPIRRPRARVWYIRTHDAEHSE